MRRRSTLHTSSRATTLGVPAGAAWAVVAGGADTDQWYVEASPFVLRGAIDRIVGDRGRRWSPPGTQLLHAGDTAGFWRVTEADHEARRLELTAEVRAPGTVVLITSVKPAGPDGTARCRVCQTVRLIPHGLLGQAYLLADLPAREAVIELTHRRLLADLDGLAEGNL